ncbi:MAG: phospho-sugar mutase [Planctomycetaceae bacterium]
MTPSPDIKLRLAVEQAVIDKKITESAATNLLRWLTEPQYQRYVPAISNMIEAEQFAELDRLFWEVIPFGTGGRRGMMSDFGSATINDRTIAESANGLATYFKSFSKRETGKAVIAGDTRHRSTDFAKLTATTLAANGLTVYLFDDYRSTPELSFAVRHLGCDVGVMITASHNPPSDNGFKAYWSNGAQVLPPHDKGIIECVYQSKEIPTIEFDQAVAAGKIQMIGKDVDDAYTNAVLEQSLSSERRISAVFSPLHGVGMTAVHRVLEKAGFEQLKVYEPHKTADGNFPNVPDHLPNPERPQAFAPIIAWAEKTDVQLILASDPDADRLGACVRGADGKFVHLTGNRIGVLLTDYVLSKGKASGKLTPQHYVVETLVTTPLIADIARAYGVQAVDNLLVGFKYIAQTMDNLGPEKFLIGVEESLGYLTSGYARDKDASVAALFLMEHAAELAQQGKSLLERLDEIYTEHGYYLESQRSEVCEGSRGQAQIAHLMQTFRDLPPTELAGLTLSRVHDFKLHEIRDLPRNVRATDLPEPSGDLLIVETAPAKCQLRFAIRPSGTEPKIKFYFFAKTQAAAGQSLDEVKNETAETLNAFETELSQWIRTVIANS